MKRPDPTLGVFETLLTLEGRPVELEAHLGRLDSSLRRLYGKPTPREARSLVIEHAHGLGLGRIHLGARLDEDRDVALAATASSVDPNLFFPPLERGAALHSLVVDDGLGEHKWADRALLQRSEAAAPSGSVPLIFDRDGLLLEAARANVFVVRDGQLATPPTDGRILPGTTRAKVIESAKSAGLKASEETVTLNDLLDAEEAFLTGSVRGIEPIRQLDGRRIRFEGTVTSRLAGALKQQWWSFRVQEPV